MTGQVSVLPPHWMVDVWTRHLLDHRPALTLAIAAPCLATLGPWASFTPGEGGSPYFYRILIALSLPVAAVYAYTARRCAWVWVMLASSAALVAWSALSLFWTADFQSGLRETVGLGICVAGFVATSVILRIAKTPLTWLAHGYVLAIFVTLPIVAWEKMSGKHLYTELTFGNQTEAMASFYNPNNFASFLSLALVAALYLALRATTWRRAAYVLIAGVAMALIIDIGSRAALLGAVGGDLAFFVIRYNSSAGRRFRIGLWSAAILTVTGALALVIVRLASRGLSSEVLKSDLMRLDLSLRALEYTVATWGRGVGAGGFEDTLAADPEPSAKVTNLHNVYFEILCQLGLLGAAAVVVMLTCALPMRKQAYDATPKGRRGLGVGAAWVLLVGGVTTSSMLAEPSWWLGWTLVVVALGPAYGGELHKTEAHITERRNVS